MVDALIELNSSEDVKQGSIILSSGNYTTGVLQVFYNGSWVDVCSNMTTANVACKQLGFYGVIEVFSDLAAIG